MNQTWLATAALVVIVLTCEGVQPVCALEVGKAAPDFTLEDTTGAKVSLHQFRGHKLVLIEFIGAAFAPTCTDNVKVRGLDYQRFENLNVQVIGISSDSTFALKAFADSVNAPFPLLSDQSLRTIRSYGVLAPDKVRALRSYFLVDQKGILRKQWMLGLAGDDMVFSSEPIFAAIREIGSKR